MGLPSIAPTPEPTQVIYPLGRDRADILLINVPQRHYSGATSRLPGERALPPLGLAYLATYLETAGLAVSILDSEFFGLTIGETIEAATEFPAMAYGINCYSPTAPMTYDIAGGLWPLRRPLFIGGVHATHSPADVRRACPSATVIPGFAELPLLAHLSPRRIGDAAPDPLRLPISREHLASDPYIKRTLTTSCLVSSRGCPQSCSFCTSANTSFTFRDLGGVVAEMVGLLRDHQVRHFQFLDDLFLLNPRRTREFMRLLSECGLDRQVTWQGLTTVRSLHLHVAQSLIEPLRAAGCTRLSIGFESGNDRVRALAGKKYANQMAMDIVRECRRHGINTKGFFMLGFPRETRAEMRDTVDFVFRLKECGLDDISIFQVKPYPGTRLREMVLREFGPDGLDDYYEYDARAVGSSVRQMRALSRESFGTRKRLAEVCPEEIERIIASTTSTFYE